ncbi:hypothetical protein BCR42DRAFT_393590 [Absidia repens]|uniref:Uncharacterized protein n=1 Tax=Absidia repens TaxID=90262 RepID=A0A1X2IEA3_9FUNG|nr:hypothetical protein BCR42DRAFT_393590 [Absidia repens]
MQLLKTFFIVGTLVGVVFSQAGSYHKQGYKHKSGVIKRTILIDGCTGKPVREKPVREKPVPEITVPRNPEPLNNGRSGGLVNDVPRLADYGLEEYADEIKEIGKQLGIEDLGL